MTSRFCVDLSADSAISKRPEFEKDVLVFEEPNLLCCFLGKHVTVKNANWTVKGLLTWFEGGSRIPHKPSVLFLLANDGCRLLMRGWEVILA